MMAEELWQSSRSLIIAASIELMRFHCGELSTHTVLRLRCRIEMAAADAVANVDLSLATDAGATATLPLEDGGDGVMDARGYIVFLRPWLM